jgi:membrane-associated phospholipid phosphatase
MALLQFLADHRNVFLTKLFLVATFVGDVQGYILIITLIYVIWDKQLAVRLSILVLLTMSLNYLLKISIKSPRPFVREGTFLKQWAVSAENAKELASEYSMPSGHAMAASAFYSYLYAFSKNRYVKVIAVLIPILTGLSRPYLGVHYMEDVLVGWVIGLSIALISIKYADRVSTEWTKLSPMQQVGITVAASLVLWLLSIVIHGWRIDGQPRAFLGYAGFLTGIVFARPLELKTINFCPKSSKVVAKILRYLLTISMVICTLVILDKAFAMIADKFSMLGCLLQYVRYTVAGVVSIFLAPLLFTKLRLAETRVWRNPQTVIRR